MQIQKETADHDLVSVIIPTFNRESTLKDSINSVLNQTYKDIEVILVDDGSTDNTKQIVSEINDERLKYYYKENAGACAARNDGVKFARGKYIAFHDSDDIWHASKLEKQVKKIKEEKCDLVFCKSLRDDGNKKTPIPKRIPEGTVSKRDDIFGVGTQTLCGKAEVFKENKFDASFPRLQELEWLYRTLNKYTVYCIDEGLVEYAINEDSISNDVTKIIKALRLLRTKYPKIRLESPQTSMHAIRDIVLMCFPAKGLSFKDRCESLKLFMLYYPGMIRYWVVRKKQEHRR